MITVLAKFVLKDDQNTKSKFTEKARNLMASSKQAEGCISYDLYEDIYNNEMRLISVWKDEAAISAYNKTESFTANISELVDYIEEKEIKFYKKI